MRNSTRSGFTLLELIVVMAIIALLLSLVLLALSGIARRGRIAECANNLRTLQRAHWSYMADHNSRFIDAGLPHHSLGNEDVVWINTLAEQYENERVVQSPLDESPHWPAEKGGQDIFVPGTDGIFRRTSYGLNNYLTQYSPTMSLTGRRAERLTAVKNPARTVHFLMMVFTDTNGFCGADHIHVENWGPDKHSGAARHIQTNAAGGLEAEWTSRANYGFLDGHVETLEFVDVYTTPEFNQFDPDVSWKVARQRPASE
jgi:prepilin-type N-terminal cleavage/methylation domain-containing protein/prepilin-type processing-associated H-X9-DG protein